MSTAQDIEMGTLGERPPPSNTIRSTSEDRKKRGPAWFVRFRGALSAFSWPCLESRTPCETTAERATIRPEEVPNVDEKQSRYTDTESAEACSKLWSIYVSEADRYDKMLVERWKDDMSGMLIFSGLFSASVTAFLIESYKTLQPDSGDTTVVLLSQLISIQLATASGRVPDPLPSSTPFQSSTASLVCNIFWFLSLALSLTCALLATLVEQWARDFLHKTEIRPSSVRRAKVYSLLYFGLKKFGMHAAVDAIPMILHASLFFFFAGLVAFLFPVNDILMYLMVSVTGVFLVLYVNLTILPIVYLDCPCRTPLSGVFWRLWSALRPFLLRRGTSGESHASMTDAMMDLSFVDTEDSRRRDKQAIAWTVASLTDDAELLPFVEAIPDAIYGPRGFHHDNDHLFLPTISPLDDQLPLATRISNLLRSCDSLPASDTLRTRRQIGSMRAIWALAMMASQQSTSWSPRQAFHWFSQMTPKKWSLYSAFPMPDKQYALSAQAAMLYSQAMCLRSFVEYFEGYTLSEPTKPAQNLNLDGLPRMLAEACQGFDKFHLKPWLTQNSIDMLISTTAMPPKSPWLRALLAGHWTKDTKRACNEHLVKALAEYLQDSFRCLSCPYEFPSTCEAILNAIPKENIAERENCINDLFELFVIDPATITSMTSHTIHDMDQVMAVSMSLLSRVSASISSEALSGIYRYIAHRSSDMAISYILGSCDLRLWGHGAYTPGGDESGKVRVDLSKHSPVNVRSLSFPSPFKFEL